ncbi:MAG TPA: nuclear transport factor 2 family protein [Thermoanaerobaculia bacterium]|jgi:ketosteroid isomerase-like protein|nr:nuclear transport factor 2 family protein [Thermoanaerobaculia bacterium]
MRIAPAPLLALLLGCATAAIEPRIRIARNSKAITDAWLRHDVTTVAKYFADDFTEVTRSGKRLTKKDILAAVASNDETETIVSDQIITDYGNVAIETSRIVDKGRKTSGELYTVETRVMNVWRLRSGEWRIIAAQTTFVNPR